MANESVDEFVADLLARSNFPTAGAAVTCAVSGGADSLALLALACRAGCDVTAVHVDHGIRPGSSVEAELVRRVADELGATFRSESVEVGLGPNLEARARAARYAVLPDDVLLGHTADDQAETMLLNLMRGSGPSGMAAMAVDARRPILALRRADTERLCELLGIEWFDDPSNDDPQFRRNRVRSEALPLLADIADRDVAALLARQAPLFAEQADFLNELAAPLDPTDCAAMRQQPVVLVRIAVRRWFADTSGEPYPLDEASVARVLQVINNEIVATEVVGGWRVARSAGRLALVSP